MHNTLLILTAAGFAAMTTPLQSAQKNTNINVTTTIYDYNGATQLLMRSDDYNGAGSAIYASYIDTSGNLALYLGSPRALYITPDEPVGSQPSAPPRAYYNYAVQAHSQCYDQHLNQVPFPSLVNGSGNCQVGVEFHYNGLVYKLAMGPNVDSGGPATGLATVVCNGVSNNQCVNWTVAPNTAAASPNVANLYYYNTSHASSGWVFVGQYYQSFLIHVTNP